MGGKNPTQHRLPDMRFRREEDQYDFASHTKRVCGQSPLGQSLDDRASKRICVAANKDDSDTDESEDDRKSEVPPLCILHYSLPSPGRAFGEPTSNQKRIREVSPELPNKRRRDEDYRGASSSEDEPLDEFVTRAKRVREQSPLEQSLDDHASKRIRVTENEDGSNAESDGTVEPGKRAGCAVISTLLTTFLSLHLAGTCIESQICATNDGRE